MIDKLFRDFVKSIEIKSEDREEKVFESERKRVNYKYVPEIDKNLLRKYLKVKGKRLKKNSF